MASAWVLTPAAAGAVDVHMDQNTVVDLPRAAGAVVVGNPAIADVSLVTPRRIALLGRAYGLTNVIVTDRMGKVIFSQEVNVAPAPGGRVSVFRGINVSNFACSPRCERTPMPGEHKTDYDPYASGYKEYGDRTRQEASGQSSGSQ
ncbi:MAG: pilus assembly protein N-terminal domain-containing protein [Phenylobacterium sp.]